MEKAVCYIRVSTEEQARGGVSLAAQEEKLAAYCRLFRDAEDAPHQTKAWDKAGVALHLVDMGGQILNTATAMGRFFLNMMAGFAEPERNLIAERTATALAHKKAHRKAYSPTPYGFDRVEGTLIANAEEQKILAQIFAWGKAGWSLREIAGELNRQGIPTKQGGQWYTSTVRYPLQNNLYEEVA